MTKNTASHASVGHVVRSPRRASNTTTASAEAKNRIPGTVRSVVGCHSVIRAVTSAFVERPAAYSQTCGPNALSRDATAATSATANVLRALGSRSATSSSHASPTTTGPRKKLPWRFAQTATISGIAQAARGWRRRSARITSTSASSTIPKSWGRRPSATAETTKAASAMPAARRRSAPRDRQ
jgi:hypothetical protein